MARPKKRKFISKIQKLINKGIYKARPKGRPPKNKEWNYKRGQYELAFPKAILKAANERLRKLEKVSKLAKSSEIYQMMMKYAVSYPKGKGKIYDPKAIAKGQVRFLNKTEFEKLSATEKEYYLERIRKFMDSQSSTASGIKDAHKRAYESFMKDYGDKYPNLSFEQYSEFFENYNANVVGDSESHFSYEDWAKVLTHINIDEAMTDNQMEKVMEYVRSNNWVGMRNSEESKYLLRI